MPSLSFRVEVSLTHSASTARKFRQREFQRRQGERKAFRRSPSPQTDFSSSLALPTKHVRANTRCPLIVLLSSVPLLDLVKRGTQFTHDLMKAVHRILSVSIKAVCFKPPARLVNRLAVPPSGLSDPMSSSSSGSYAYTDDSGYYSDKSTSSNGDESIEIDTGYLGSDRSATSDEVSAFLGRINKWLDGVEPDETGAEAEVEDQDDAEEVDEILVDINDEMQVDFD